MSRSETIISAPETAAAAESTRIGASAVSASATPCDASPPDPPNALSTAYVTAAAAMQVTYAVTDESTDRQTTPPSRNTTPSERPAIPSNPGAMIDAEMNAT